MATINDLIEQISNPQLRERVKEEVSKLTKQKKFGLVYETHEPEMTLMYDAPVRVGSKVVKREDTESKITPDKLLVVKNVRDGVATCERLNAEESFEMKVADVVATYTIPCSDLICIAENGEPIYPYLKPVDSVQNAPDSDLWHTLIEADNYHALQLLAYLYPGQVDCIYIDPPYNKKSTKDWKYNCEYVDGNDSYRHSKWLSMIEARLVLAKKLLNPNESVLIVTIDEEEYSRLGCMLEEVFPEAKIQMISTVINPAGVSRIGEFSRTDEYIFFVKIGTASPCALKLAEEWKGNIKGGYKNNLRWNGLIRTGTSPLRIDHPLTFYPIFVSKDGKSIKKIGDPIGKEKDRNTVEPLSDSVTVWPIRSNGEEGRWQIGTDRLNELYLKGFVRLGKFTETGMAISYLKKGEVAKVEKGLFPIVGNREDGSIIVDEDDYQAQFVPGTQWWISSHDATQLGTKLLSKIIGKRFDFPKSLYAVHDTIRFFVANKPNALIVDFFAGSGTTLHSVNLLNKEDGGNRRCIMVTNNEISAEEEEAFKAKGLHKGDEEWEKYGIARYVNWPRTKCSILGIDVNDKPLEGDYISTNTDEVVQKRIIKQLSLDLSEGKESEKLKKQILQMVGKKSNTEVLFNIDEIDDFMENIDDATDTIYIVTANNKAFKTAKEALAELPEITKSVPQKIPMADGFKANAAFFKLGFLDKKSVDHGKQLLELMPVLWMKAGAHGVCPTNVEEGDLIVLPENKMALLIDEYEYDELLRQLIEHPEIETVYIVNDNEEEYYRLAQGVKAKHTYQLYRDYLDNFKINIAKK
ncbi:MAG: hypothetical protein MJZ29_04045 [Bacteroidaceae bacterium]|nr:hypothetical protein [Bacteroidaceae bacterium]